MNWQSFENNKPHYGTRFLCKIKNNPYLYAILVYIPYLNNASKTWYCEIDANYFTDSFVEYWCDMDDILHCNK